MAGGFLFKLGQRVTYNPKIEEAKNHSTQILNYLIGKSGIITKIPAGYCGRPLDSVRVTFDGDVRDAYHFELTSAKVYVNKHQW